MALGWEKWVKCEMGKRNERSEIEIVIVEKPFRVKGNGKREKWLGLGMEAWGLGGAVGRFLCFFLLKFGNFLGLGLEKCD